MSSVRNAGSICLAVVEPFLQRQVQRFPVMLLYIYIQFTTFQRETLFCTPLHIACAKNLLILKEYVDKMTHKHLDLLIPSLFDHGG